MSNTKTHILAIFLSVFAFSQVQSAQSTPPTQNPLSYTVTDLGTLGGSTSTASSASGLNLAGMIVGSSTMGDKSEHAFLYVDSQMYDLNLLCDLSTSDFKVLTVAKTIDDCLEIVGEGITLNGDKHAFLMTPTPVDGGRWCYSCCQWIWKQEGGGWWWENNSHSYQWHGGSGSHGSCPDHPPHCYWWPLPCPEGCGCGHWDPLPGWCYCCINGRVYIKWADDCKASGGQCYESLTDAREGCELKWGWCCLNGQVVKMTKFDCRKKGGQWFPTKDEADAHCKPMCWCCMPGRDTKEVVYVTEEECRQHKGQCYGSEQEAKASCNPTPTPTPTPTPNPSDCWCCVDMTNGMGVANTTPQDCKNRGACDCTVGSTCFATEQEAIDKCFPCWCCVPGPNGTFTYVRTTEADCFARGGQHQCYRDKLDAIAACEAPPGPWCCAPAKDKNGAILPNTFHAFPATASQCAAEGGQMFNTEQEALAHCNLCWCCPTPGIGGVFLEDATQCKQQLGAQCYPTKEDAIQGCAAKSPTPAVTSSRPPTTCWVCIDRNVVQISRADAQARKLQCFNSREEAQRSCNIEVPSWWCCVDGKVVQVSEAEARKKGNQCYRSEQEARAHCKEKTVWCCMDGQVVQMTEEQCRARGGRAFRSEQEARRNCKGKTCWVCSDGRVLQLPEEQARSRGMQCFSSKEEATRSCRSKENTCWTCINGRVGQISEAKARSRGLPCFGSREEAARNCSGGEGGPRPTPKPGRRR